LLVACRLIAVAASLLTTTSHMIADGRTKPDSFIGSVSPATNALNMRLPLAPRMFVMTDESLMLAPG
jgi:hypothetical protein